MTRMSCLRFYQFKLLSQIKKMSCVFVAVSILSGQAKFVFAAEVTDKTIVIAAENSWPPFSDKRGRGISYELAKAAFATQGYDIKTVVVPYARALKLTKAGEVHACWNVTRQPNTELVYHFGDEALLEASISLYYNMRNAQVYKSVAEIPDQTKIGVIIGYEYGDEYEQHKKRFDIASVSSQKSLLKMLRAKRIELAFMFDEVFKSTVETNNFDMNDYVQGAHIYKSEIFIAFDADSKQSQVYSEALDLGIRVLRETERYDAILRTSRDGLATGVQLVEPND